MDVAEMGFKPCPCGYQVCSTSSCRTRTHSSQICMFCYHHIKSNLNGRCPACRREYLEQNVEFTAVAKEEWAPFLCHTRPPRVHLLYLVSSARHNRRSAKNASARSSMSSVVNTLQMFVWFNAMLCTWLVSALALQRRRYGMPSTQCSIVHDLVAHSHSPIERVLRTIWQDIQDHPRQASPPWLKVPCRWSLYNLSSTRGCCTCNSGGRWFSIPWWRRRCHAC